MSDPRKTKEMEFERGADELRRNPIFIDRVERKYLVGVEEDGLARFFRELTSFLAPHELEPVQDITNVATVYFDNKDYDLLRYILLIRRTHILFRLRAYEYYNRPPQPIAEYWMEVKIRNGDRRRKKRFRLKRSTLQSFLDGKDVMEEVADENREEVDRETLAQLFAEMRETYFTWGLKPALFVNYKRIAFQNRTERLSLDWDIQYYLADDNILDRDSWKYPVERSAGKAKQVVMELKYPASMVPVWIANLEKNFPVAEQNYVKPVDGMGFLFAGPLKEQKEAASFLRMIKAYNAETQPLG